MTTHREITKNFAREYVKGDKGEILDALVASTGWSRDHARRTIVPRTHTRVPRAISNASPARGSNPCDAVVVLQARVAALGSAIGHVPRRGHGRPVERLVRFRELDKIQPRVSPEVRGREPRAISPTTINQ